jgi:L-asparaginase / beta-aspartyl-peptidase
MHREPSFGELPVAAPDVRADTERREVPSVSPYALAIHGGAGALALGRVPSDRLAEMHRDLSAALEQGIAVLERGGGALDAVVCAVGVLEDSRVFNAARGAVLRRDGGVRLDASVMSGKDRSAGAVTLVRTVRNPVHLARAVLERGREVLLAGADADRLALELGLATEPASYFVMDYRLEQKRRLDAAASEREGTRTSSDRGVTGPGDPDQEGQTVGAVALDAHGHLAAATSTGGVTNAEPGRIGDSPIVGAGTWASDESCAVSGTGAGEFFIRSAFAHEVHGRMVWAGSSLELATRAALDQVVALGGHGGCVAIDRAGNLVAPFTTLAMPRAYQSRGGEPHVYVLEPRAAGRGTGG